MKTVGMVTIGQSPRDDTVPEMEKVLGPAIRVVQAGALDGLGRAEIAALAPGPADDALVTRLGDGTQVVVAKRAILDRLQRCLDRLAPAVDAAAVLCTGTFPRFRCTRPVLEPDRILLATAQAIFSGGTLGVLSPLEEQRAKTAAQFRTVSERQAIAVASPYADPGELVRAAEALRRAGASLVVMNCMGYTQAMKALVRDVAAAPVLLPTSLLARVIAEVV